MCSFSPACELHFLDFPVVVDQLSALLQTWLGACGQQGAQRQRFGGTSGCRALGGTPHPADLQRTPVIPSFLQIFALQLRREILLSHDTLNILQVVCTVWMELGSDSVLGTGLKSWALITLATE